MKEPDRLPSLATAIAPIVLIALVATAPPLRADADFGGSPPESALSKAEQAIKARDWRNAMFYLQKAEREEPKNANVYNWEGYVSRQKGELDRAFEYYAKALKLDPNHRGAHEYIGETYLLAGKPDKAREHLARLQQICGANCEQTRDLAVAIDKYAAGRPRPGS